MKLNEFAKLSFRLLEDINQALHYGQDIADMEDIQNRINVCIAGLHESIREHDSMSKSENNPERYSRMCLASPIEDANNSLDIFLSDVTHSRQRNRIADVSIITRVIIEKQDGDYPAMGFAHLGSAQESESMCAWALGLAMERRREYIAQMGEQGKKAAHL